MMLIVNPNAGKGGYRSCLAGVLDVFCRADWQPTVFYTKEAGEAQGLVEKYAGEYDMVTCMGGDGTLSEVAGGMMRLEDKRPIGYIPLGTANDVARTLGLSSKPVQAANTVVSGRIKHYDIGRFGENSFFTYVSAFGAFTEVSYATPQEYKHALGHMAYMLEGMRQLKNITFYHAAVEYDGGIIEDDFIFGAVTNSTSVAGLVRLDSDKVALDDGVFEVLLVKKPLDIIDIGDIISRVLSSDFSGSNVMFLKTREISFAFDKNVAWTRDGEDGGCHSNVHIVNCHPGIDIIV